ncbi:MAG: ChbG/HpnK family deacetylase [Armatimonadetes bacterium]|nr:ChbG/HpnK family deacetylase [Armatimonadota bacterium]MDE2205110.1 ChbG/HpnK family deacetylase [Armatimonadota bacterium]
MAVESTVDDASDVIGSTAKLLPYVAAMKLLIVNADDFGMTARVNAAVISSHRSGVLTSASLMTAEVAFEQAVSLARDNADLGVGLHLALSCDRSLLGHGRLTAITRRDNRFHKNPAFAGLLYALSGTAFRQAAEEMRAQFQRFSDTGLPWSHVDGHQHMHMHPRVWRYMLGLCAEYGVYRLRVPHEPLIAHFRLRGDGPGINTAGLCMLRAIRRRNLAELDRRRADGVRWFVCDQSFGTLQSSNMNTAYVEALIGRLGDGTFEIYAHPGTAYARRSQRKHDEIDVEHAALISTSVRLAVTAARFRLCTYAEAAASEQCSPGRV